jgi:hypothetical protein
LKEEKDKEVLIVEEKMVKNKGRNNDVRWK